MTPLHHTFACGCEGRATTCPVHGLPWVSGRLPFLDMPKAKPLMREWLDAKRREEAGTPHYIDPAEAAALLDQWEKATGGRTVVMAPAAPTTCGDIMPPPMAAPGAPAPAPVTCRLPVGHRKWHQSAKGEGEWCWGDAKDLYGSDLTPEETKLRSELIRVWGLVAEERAKVRELEGGKAGGWPNSNTDLTKRLTLAGSRLRDLEAALVKAYMLAFSYWNNHGGRDPGGDEAKELRRAIYFQCLKPLGIIHPLGWEEAPAGGAVSGRPA